MNKTITASVGGFVFNIEEDAYETLHHYLRAIRSSIGNDESVEEIMQDIELRIAEIFRDILAEQKKEVIIRQDVLGIISIMGEPEAYGSSENTGQKENYFTTTGDKQFFRDPDERLIGGVCSGISKYFGWDPLFLRIVFIVMAFGMGFGFLFYLILWIIIPEAKTTADKLRMSGEKIDVETIRQRFSDFKKDVHNLTSPETKKRMQHRSSQFTDSIRGAFINIVDLFGKATGFIFVILGILLLIWLIRSLLSSEFIFSVTDAGLHSIEFNSFATSFLGTETKATLVWLSLIGILLVPVTGFILGGIRLITGKKLKTKIVNSALVLISTFSIVTLIILSISTGLDFSNESRVEETLELSPTASDTLYIKTNNDPYFSDHFEDHHQAFFELMRIETKSIIYGFPFLRIEKSPNEITSVNIEREAHGSNQREAIQRAENIQYSFHQNDSLLHFNPWFNVPSSDLIRGQQLKINIQIPVGKTIYFSPGSDRIIYDVQNMSQTRDEDMVGKYWIMTEEGLHLSGK